MMYASTGEKALLDKLNYMLDELQECQKQTPDGWFITGKRGRRVICSCFKGMWCLTSRMKPDNLGIITRMGTHGIVSIRFWRD